MNLNQYLLKYVLQIFKTYGHEISREKNTHLIIKVPAKSRTDEHRAPGQAVSCALS